MNKHIPFCSVLVSVCCCLLSVAEPALAKEGGDNGRPGNGNGLSLLAAYVHQFDANLDEGGDFRVDRYILRLDGRKRQSDELSLGVGVGYELSDYSFSGTAATPGVAPWDQVHLLNLSASATYTPDKNWKLFIAPSLGVAAESGGDWDDSLVYGGIAWASYRFGPELVLGLGAGLFSKPEQYSVFPVIVVDWKISDRMRLSNPRSEGVAGPAGLELSYRFDGGTSVAAGGAYRSQRFRLDDRGHVPGGAGEDRSFPVWLKLSTKVGHQGTLSFLGGVMAGGSLTVEDSHGNKVDEQDYDAAPFLSSTLSFKF